MKQCLLMFMFMVLARLAALAGPVVMEGDLWRYYKGTNYPAGQGGVNWTQTAYDDGAWLGPSPSPFGYSDSYNATVLPDMMSNYPSVFFRTKFVIADTSEVSRLTLAADYDDGFVAYINGQEVWRLNMTNGVITNSTRALGSHEGSRSTDALCNEKLFFTLNPGVLVNGTNVLAVSGHNQSLTSSDFTMLAELYTNIGLVRGPFIQTPESNIVTIVWRTDALSDSRVDWGGDTNYSGGFVEDPALVRQHEVRLTNLTPGATVFYRVQSSGVTLDEGASFRVPCATGQMFRFAVVGDFGDYDDAAHTQIAARVNSMDFDFILTVGDNIYDYGQAGGYDPAIFTPYEPTLRRAPIYPAVGNHDVRNGNAIWMTNYFVLPQNGPPSQKEVCYSYDWGDAHFVVIDSNASQDNAYTNALPGMLSWLTNDLARASKFWKVVVFHHPPFTSQGVHAEQLRVQNDICPLLEEYGVQLVLQGHNHFFERINPIRGVSYFTAGAGGNNLYTFVTNAPAYTAYRNNSVHSFMIVEAQGKRMDLRAIDVDGNEIDRRVMDYGAPFVTDGELDSAAWGRATNGLVIHAAIRSNLLYVATQDAGEGGDNFILLAENISTNRPAQWSKSGNVMQWSAFLADENNNGFAGWFGPSEAVLNDWASYGAMTPGTNNNAPFNNGVLEGVLNLNAHFGHFPTQMLFCAAPYGNLDGTTNYPSSQCPANNGDGDITSDEFLALATRAIALDLPTASASAVSVTNEAGIPVSLTGTGTAPSGYGLALAWQQLGGPAGFFGNAATGSTTFLLATNIATNVTITLKLTVNDTRFDTTDDITLVFTTPIDTDADGLTDQEESTGLDNFLTVFNPAGQITNPNDSDTDNDGVGDGHESVAGTDPQNPASFLAIQSTTLTPSGLVIRWPSASNRLYDVLATTNLDSPPFILRTNLPATPALNVITTPPTPGQFLHLRVGPQTF